MGMIRMVLYFCFILHLPCPIRAAFIGCDEWCGDVSIPYPFGIRTGCYANNNSWFRVTCNETANGPPKPFISRINMELLGSTGDNTVRVNNPVTYLNCGGRINDTTSPSSVNLEGTPFYFSSSVNSFGSTGCGYLATMFRNNQTDQIASCLQKRCGDEQSLKDNGPYTNLNFNGCVAEISESMTSYTTSITEVINPAGSYNRCTSAFISDFSFLYCQLIPNYYCSTEYTTHVPAILEWNPCDLEISMCPEVQDMPSASCLDIAPQPLGIMNDWFRVTCNETSDGPKPYISGINMQLLNVSFSNGTIVVNNPVTYFDCLNKDGDQNTGVSVNLTGTPFSFLKISNRFVSIGCGSLATFLRSPTDDYPVRGCLQPACGDFFTSNLSCSTDVPSGLSSFTVNMKDQTHPSNGSSRRWCGAAFIVDQSYLDILERINSNPSNWTLKNVPASLKWATPKRGFCTCEDHPDKSFTHDGHCLTSLSQSYLCFCSSTDDGYVLDDRYLSTDLCKESPPSPCKITYRYCHLLCLNAPGNNCSSPSSCPDGYEYSEQEDRCKLIFHPPHPKNTKHSKGFSTILVFCSTCIGTIFSLLGAWAFYHVLERRKYMKRRQKYFKRNGGLRLQQYLSSNEGNAEKTKLFASTELEKATVNFNENRILGRGGQGTVYKGMLTDGSIVAIKKPKLVEDQKILDEMTLEQFVNEVIILSQINHRNVVALLGCCLDTQVPLLVYEFVPNGTLSQLIQDPNEEFQLTWDMRLRTAIEIANALSYLHSAASVPIYHRDIKSSNILLDDKYRAKVSDFGTSRSVSLEQTHVTTRVQGTFGYMDPEYFRSSQFTEKSDVYSLGVVLVEHLTGQKAIFSTQSEEEVRGLAAFFLLSMEKDSLFEILDQNAMLGPEEEIEEFAKLAKRCLNLNGKERPTMKQVALKLEWIRSPEEVDDIDQTAYQDSDMDDMIEPSTTDSCSMSGSVINDSVTLALDA